MNYHKCLAAVVNTHSYDHRFSFITQVDIARVYSRLPIIIVRTREKQMSRLMVQGERNGTFRGTYMNTRLYNVYI